ncbi:hypothetical protein F5Y08DRAFT_344366 [Xylaria arbuscula]|nr:hypothetical protein F5Y08DRAFT_344366 [Xylaria arbuscula]
MSTSSHQYPVVRAVTVLPASQTKFYFIPITGLQEGTTFRDIWTHLKKLVKRLEHITVYPDTDPVLPQGWILVHKFVNYAKVIEALRNPVYVEATKQSTMITPSSVNVECQTTIQLPLEPSSHVAKIIADAAGCAPACICFPDAPFTGAVPNCVYRHLETCRDTITWNQRPQVSKRLASNNTRPEIVIAHGTYKPEAQRQQKASPAAAPVAANAVVAVKSARRSTRKTRRRDSRLPPTPPPTPPNHYWELRESPVFMPTSPAFEYQLNYQLGYPADYQPYCNYVCPYYNFNPRYPFDPTIYYYHGYPSQGPQWHGMSEQHCSVWANYPIYQHGRPQGQW